ncbi:MAG: AAA family ATPase [Anaerolineaceae bacterium]|nr:AAA family ATPase [Anaerolineaceae bacterium]
MNYFYPSDQQAIFTNRRQELATLNHYHHSLINGPVKHVALFGLRRIGKTLLLKEFMRKLTDANNAECPVFLDFSVICSSPENFAFGFIGSICYWLLDQGKNDPEPFLNPASLGPAILKAGGNKLYDEIQPILQELQRARPDRQALLRQAFRFPRLAAKALDKKLVLICDEFQEIRTLENFPNSRNVVALLRAELQSQSDVQYILAGSAISVLAGLLSNPDSPLFALFTRMAVDPFDRESTQELVNKLLVEPLDTDLYPLLHSLTGGHPFYIIAVAQRVSYLVEVVQRPISPDVIKQAFLVETLSPGGRIYDFCQYVYDLSLQKAKGYGSLKSVLQILAQEEGLTATEVARQLHVVSATASDYLRWLCEVDLVIEKDQAYFFRDPVLRFWVGNVIKGIEVSLTAEPMDLKGLVQRLDHQFQRVSEELGDAEESMVRELMRQFHGQSIQGELFQKKGAITLPVFGEVESEISANGQIELDAIGGGSERWVVEVKWRNKRAGVKELEKLLQHAQEQSAKGWFVSRSGFSADAIQYASENGLFITDKDGLETLRKLIVVDGLWRGV